MIDNFIIVCYYKANLSGNGCMLNNYTDNNNVFVTEFKIGKDNIEVFYSNNTSELVKKTAENQKKLLNKMTSQIPVLNKYVLNKKRELISSYVHIGIEFVGIAINLIMSFYCSVVIIPMLAQLMISVCTLITINSTSKLKKHYVNLLDELEKFNIWLENQALLEKNVPDINIVDPNGIVEKHSLDKKININIIDSLSLHGLKEILIACKKMEFSNDLEPFTQDMGKQKNIGIMPGNDLIK